MTMQLFPALPPAVEDALRASIRRFGVLVPVVKDQNGRTLDGHHRSRIATEEGVSFRVDVVTVTDDDEAREIAATLNSDRRHLTADQRQEVALALRESGHSFRAIAGALGVDPKTVRNDVAGGDYSPPARSVGADGKSYPAKRPTVVTAKNEREASRAFDAIAKASDLPRGVIDVKRAERIAREDEAERLRLLPVEPRSEHGLVQVRHGDFRDVLGDLDGTVDAIITDPPYPREFWDLYGDLAELARRLLKPDGILAVLIGGMPEMLDNVDFQMRRHMRPRWRGAYVTRGAAWRNHIERVSSNWKPVLIYARPDSDEDDYRNISTDVFESGGDDKTHHHWGQSESGMAAMVSVLTRPSDLLVDPFLGGGTMAVVCRELGRSFVGCDIDAAAVERSRARLAA